MAEARKGPGFLTGEAFEKLLTKASQPIRDEQPLQVAEETSEYHQTGD